MATTIGETTSRLRNTIKSVREDAFLTDRYLYSMASKYGKMLIRRQDNEKKIKNTDSLFQDLSCIDLIEVSKIDACCPGVTDCTFMRTKDPLPKMVDGSDGPLLRSVFTIDYSLYFYPTTPKLFTAIAGVPNYKYNKTKYYWYSDGHLFFPNVPFDAVGVEALWEDSIAHLKCEGDADTCVIRQDEPSIIPDYLYAEVEQNVLKELGVMIQTPADTSDDKQSVIRS